MYTRCLLSVTYTDNQLSGSSITQFPVDYCSYSSEVPPSDQLQFNYYYPALITVPIQSQSLQNSMAQTPVFEPSNHFPVQQNLQYFIFPQQFNGQSSDLIIYPQYLNSSVNQSLDSSHSSFNQLNSTMIEISNNHNYSTIGENKQERKKRQNRAAAQRARERERNLLNNLIDEYESLKKEHERKVEEIKKLNTILDRLKEEKK